MFMYHPVPADKLNIIKMPTTSVIELTAVLNAKRHQINVAHLCPWGTHEADVHGSEQKLTSPYAKHQMLRPPSPICLFIDLVNLHNQRWCSVSNEEVNSRIKPFIAW
jgi:hypothetical protein